MLTSVFAQKIKVIDLGFCAIIQAFATSVFAQKIKVSTPLTNFRV